MADRTSASIFGMVFAFLAEKPDARAKKFAKAMWDETRAFDFDPYQMDADDAMVRLGLAKSCRKCGSVDYAGEEVHECET